MRTERSGPDPEPDEPWWIKHLRRLLKSESISQRDFDEAKRIAEQTDGDLSAVLARLGFSGERERRQAHALGYAFADLDRVRPDPAAHRAIPAELARRCRVLPLRRLDGNLWVATDEPERPGVWEALREASGDQVRPVIVVSDALDAALREAYPEEN